MRLELKEHEIIWMGRSPSKPEGFMIPTHLKVILLGFFTGLSCAVMKFLLYTYVWYCSLKGTDY